jgi:beta-galactosidase
MVCDSKESAAKRHFDFYDVHCWNYGRRYSLARELEPNKAVIISESASTLSTRGFYEFPLPTDKTKTTKSLQVSSYDLHAPWWAEIADDDFMWQQNEPYIAGEFVWTGFDYLGEPEPYTNMWAGKNGLTATAASRSSYFGIVDLSGIPKDRYYLYKSYWNTDKTTNHILPHWNWPERVGQNVPVFVYTNGDCAELFVNGKSQGKKYKNPKSEKSIDRFRLMWNDVVYQPGELRVVAYKEGEIIGVSVVKTAGEPVQLKLTPDRTIIGADGKDLSYILIEANDKDGNLCPLADNKVEIKINGGVSLAGIDNGNPQSLNSFKSNSINLFYGKAMLIVKSGNSKGESEIRATAKGLKDSFVRIKQIKSF